VDNDMLGKLEERLGPLHARQRLGIEADHEAQVFGQASGARRAMVSEPINGSEFPYELFGCKPGF
jgi:hypothetical protein